MVLYSSGHGKECFNLTWCIAFLHGVCSCRAGACIVCIQHSDFAKRSGHQLDASWRFSRTCYLSEEPLLSATLICSEAVGVPLVLFSTHWGHDCSYRQNLLPTLLPQKPITCIWLTYVCECLLNRSDHMQQMHTAVSVTECEQVLFALHCFGLFFYTILPYSALFFGSFCCTLPC